MKKNIGPRIEEETYSFLTRNFKNTNQGACYLLDAMPYLLPQAFSEAAEGLNSDELGAILDFMKRTQLPPSGFAGDRVVKVCDELGTMEHYNIKPGIFRAKLQSLTSFQRTALEIWGVNANRLKKERLL